MNKCIYLLLIAVILSVILYLYIQKNNSIENFEDTYRSNSDLYNEAHNKAIKTTLKDCISEVQNDFGFSDVFTKAYNNYFEIKSKEYLGYKLDSKKDPETLNKKELEIAIKVINEVPSCNDLINKYGVGQYIPKDDEDASLLNSSHRHTHDGTTHIHNHDGSVNVIGEEEQDLNDTLIIDDEDILIDEDNFNVPIEEELEILENDLLSQAAKQLMPSDIKADSEEILQKTTLEEELQKAAGNLQTQPHVTDEETHGDHEHEKSNIEITEEKTNEIQNYISKIGSNLQSVLIRLGALENKHNIAEESNIQTATAQTATAQTATAQTSKAQTAKAQTAKAQTTTIPTSEESATHKNINLHNNLIKKFNKSSSNELGNTNSKLYSNVHSETYELIPQTDSSNFSYKPEVSFDNKQPSKKILSAYGWSYMPPQFWSVPQKRPPACIPSKGNTQTVVPIYDKATPVDALDWTKVGSILPKFEYNEVHNPNYYHPGWIAQDNIKYPFSSGKKTTEYYNLNAAKSTK